MNNELIERMMTSREVEVNEVTRVGTAKPVVNIHFTFDIGRDVPPWEEQGLSARRDGEVIISEN